MPAVNKQQSFRNRSALKKGIGIVMLALLLCSAAFAVTAWLAGGMAHSSLMTGQPDYDIETQLASYEYDDDGNPLGYVQITGSRFDVGELLYGEQKIIRITVGNMCDGDVAVNLMLGSFDGDAIMNPQICFFRIDIYGEDPTVTEGTATLLGGTVLVDLTGNQFLLNERTDIAADASESFYMIISRIGSNDIYNIYNTYRTVLENDGSYTNLLVALDLCAENRTYSGFSIDDYKTSDAVHDGRADIIYTYFKAYNFEINEVSYPESPGNLIMPELLVNVEYRNGSG